MSAQENGIINAVDFSPQSHLSYKKPTLNKSGGKSVGITNTNTSKSLYISTPLMLTWGVNEWGDEQTGRKSYDFNLQFPREEYESPATKKFLEVMTEMENKIKNDAVKNHKEWFGKPKMSLEVIDALFHPMLRYPKDQMTGDIDTTKRPTMRVKLDYWENEFKCEIYDLNHKLLFPNENISPVDLIPKGTNVAVILRCGGLWFANGKFGCTWKLEQAVVKPRASLRGKCHIKLDSSDRETLMAQPDETDGDTGIVVADDSDEEEASPSTPPKPTKLDRQATEAPPDKPKKKVVRRKKVTATDS